MDNIKYAIEYQIVHHDERYDLLIPRRVIKGELEPGGEYFRTSKGLLCYYTNPIIEEKHCAGNALSMKDLRALFNADEADYTDKDIIELFFEEEQDNLILLNSETRKVINLFDLFDDTSKKELYECIEGETAVFLNKIAIEELDDINDLEKIKAKLNEYKGHLENFEEGFVAKGINAIMIKDGHPCEMDTKRELPLSMRESAKEDVSPINSGEYTVSGLYKYLKDHIIGHDQELKEIATILFLNRYSNPMYGTESILIPGPTGVGKTATFDVAAKYFNVPFKNINACNLVPDGIVGTTIEDEFASILDECNGDQERAERAILVLDEFDKLGLQELDIKKSMVDIFLKVLEGGTFPINRQLKATRNYNTVMATKVCLGSFAEAYKKEKKLGFEQSTVTEEIFDRDLLIKKGYFSKELLTRIQHFIPYKDLTEPDKRRIILESRLSAYLLKKERLLNQFGITVTGDRSFANGILEALKKDSKSVRDINNIVSQIFLPIEYEILDNPNKFKILKLSRDTVSKGTFDLD